MKIVKFSGANKAIQLFETENYIKLCKSYTEKNKFFWNEAFEFNGHKLIF